MKGLDIVAVINSITSPIEVGIYRDGKLVGVKRYEGLASDILLPTIQELLEQGVERFIYTSGPGSHMATKICYTLLKSLEILKGVPFDAISAFDLNGNKPIKALGKLYFIKEKENIITKKFASVQESSFFMPEELDDIVILNRNEPDYHIDAV